jgi:predicted RNA-binding Zn ribbon-like protein
MRFLAGDLSLDFVNTTSWSHGIASGRQELDGYDDLLRWSGKAAALPQGRIEQLAHEAAHRPAAAIRAYREAVRARDVLHDFFDGIAHADAPAPESLAAFNEVLSPALHALRLQSIGETLAWGWSDGDDLVAPLWPVLWSAGRLATSPEVRQVHACANESCGWLFIDRSRRHNRRWCDMRECGNRAKVRRYYQRKRERALVG